MLKIILDRDDRCNLGPPQYITCDAEGCTAKGATVREQDSPYGHGWARAKSGAGGWTTALRGNVQIDLCPEHSKPTT